MKALSNLENYQDIADAIREKNGESTLYKPREMAAAIRALNIGTPDALVYRGTLEDSTELPEGPSDGDLYIVGAATVFWSETDDEWKVVDVAGALTYGGSVSAYASLPSAQKVGATYEVTGSTTGHPAGFYVFDGTAWKALGSGDFEPITDAEIHEITGWDGTYYPDGDTERY